MTSNNKSAGDAASGGSTDAEADHASAAGGTASPAPTHRKANVTFTEPTPNDLDEIAASTDEPSGWLIRDDYQAETALWALRRMTSEVRRREAVAAAEIERIRQWCETTTADLRRRIGNREAQLVEYRLWLEEQDPKLAKTYKLSGGDLVRRRGSESVIVDDDTALVDWLKHNYPDAVAVTERPLKTEVKRLFGRHDDGTLYDQLGTGETVPGVRIERADDTLTVHLADTEPLR